MSCTRIKHNSQVNKKKKHGLEQIPGEERRGKKGEREGSHSFLMEVIKGSRREEIGKEVY